jgi:threonine dehydrogenase-like Zn-dependent dehydrogenase
LSGPVDPDDDIAKGAVMKALCWHGKNDIRCDTVPDPKIEDARDVIIKVTSCAICGSDLHLMDGLMPTMKSGDVLGHEFMGEVVEVGQGFTKFKKGDRIVVPFNINCGQCDQCRRGNWSVCERSNRNAEMAAAQFGFTTAGLFGYSHLTGGYAGGQAEYVRVPMADVAPMKVPEGMTDDDVLFLTDIFPTGYQGAEHAEIKPGDITAIWGVGPVGYFAIQSAKVMGAERIIAIETVPERIALARKAGATDIIDFAQEDVYERILEISKGKGADSVIDCVGMEASGAHGIAGMVDAVKEKLLPAERTTALDQAIRAVRGCGVVSVPGVYGGPVSVNMGSIVQKGLTMRSGQTHVKRYLEPLTKLIQDGKIDTTSLISHRSTKLEDGPDLYKAFKDKKDGCTKVVFNLS